MEISRRMLMRSGFVLATAAAVGPSLAGCSNEGRGGLPQGGSGSVTLPDHIPFQGVTPDLVGEDGVDSAMLAYPRDPKPVTSGPPGDGGAVTAFALTITPAPPSLANNAFWQGLNERLGFKLDMQLVPSGDFEERFQTAVAGETLPDLFTIYTNQVPSLPGVLNEVAADLTPHLSGSAVQDYPFLANIPTASWQSTVYGGKIFGIPIPRGCQSSMTLYARRDTLESRGIRDAPASQAEFLDLCRELTAPGANTWALGRVPLGYLRQMYGIPNGWSLDGGRLTSAFEAEGHKEALDAARRLVADGTVHPDADGAPASTRKTWVVNGTTPMVDDTFSGWPGFYNYPIPDGFRLSSWAPPLAEGGGTAAIHLGGATHNITAVNASAADRVPALLEVLNYLAAPFGTAEYLYKHYGEEGVHHRLEGTDPVLTDKGRSETQLSLKYLAEGPWTTYQAGRPEVAKDQFEAQTRVVPTAVANPTEGLYSETDTRKGAQISFADLESDIINGREPVSAWDDAVAQWKKDGGDDIRDEYQKALEAREG